MSSRLTSPASVETVLVSSQQAEGEETAKAARLPLQARSREKQERLMDAGERLIAERGYDKTRVADIARAAGCAVGTFYHRFGDKEVFFRELQRRFCDRVRGVTEEFFAPQRIEQLNARQLVMEFVETTVLGFHMFEGLMRAIALRLGDAPDLRGPMRDLVRYRAEKLTEALMERLDEVHHPEPALAIASATQCLIGTLLTTLLNDPGPLRFGDPALARELTRMFTAYLGIDAALPEGSRPPLPSKVDSELSVV